MRHVVDQFTQMKTYKSGYFPRKTCILHGNESRLKKDQPESTR